MFLTFFGYLIKKCFYIFILFLIFLFNKYNRLRFFDYLSKYRETIKNKQENTWKEAVRKYASR